MSIDESVAIPVTFSGLGDLEGADAMSQLTAALVSTQTQLNAASLGEIVFIFHYTGAWGRQFVAEIMALKPHQAIGMKKAYSEAIQSIALREFMNKVNLSLGGGS